MYDFDTDSTKHNKTLQFSSSAMSSPLDIANLAALINNRISEKKHFFSIEISPSSQSNSLDYNVFGNKQPLFASVTWLMDTNIQCDCMSNAPAIQLSHAMVNMIPVLLHVTCFKLDERRLNDILNHRINNIFALKGDSECETQQWKYAAKLVAAIRARKSDVSVGVAGYPETHRLASSLQIDLKHLESKIAAGADFIITNACFSVEHLLHYIKLCRQHNIIVPIVPGIYVPSSYVELVKMSELCKFTVPSDQLAIFHRHQSDNDAFQAFAIDNAATFISEIFAKDSENVFGIHFFTMNKYENICQVVDKIEKLQ